MTDTVSADLIADLRAQVEKEIAGLRITDFQALPDRDHDGDPILRLQVAFDETGADGP